MEYKMLALKFVELELINRMLSMDKLLNMNGFYSLKNMVRNKNKYHAFIFIPYLWRFF